MTFAVCAAVALSFAGVCALGAVAAESMDMPRYEAVEISYGDTLWRIAQERNYGEGDIRRAVHEISRLNGIKDGCIYPGQIIVVPLKAKKAA